VYQLTEDGERALSGAFPSQRNGIANAKAHTEMFGANDLHTSLLHKKCRFSFAWQSF
jgi:hypothetical protein